MTYDPKQHDNHAIVRYEGRPNKADRPAEKTRMRRFLEFLHLSSRKTHELGEAYAVAEVAKKQNEAVKVAAEAAERATRADLNRTEEVKMVNEEIRQIFSNEDVPDEAVKMQLKALAKRHPEIIEQSEKIDQLVERLRLTRGTQIRIVEDEPAASGPAPPGIAEGI